MTSTVTNTLSGSVPVMVAVTVTSPLAGVPTAKVTVVPLRSVAPSARKVDRSVDH